MHADSGQHGGMDTTYNLRLRDCLLGAQMLFVAFGSLVLVPLLTGLNSNVALFTAGVGTLIFQICTRGKVPIFLASSFAFIAPIIYGAQTWGMALTLGGLFCSGLVYVLLSLLIRWRGMGIILRLLPPVVTGPVIVVIGLVLAPVAVNMALGKSGDGAQQLVPENTAMIISMASLAATGISGGNYALTSVHGFRLSLSGFILPFLIIYNPLFSFDFSNAAWAACSLVCILTGLTSLDALLYGAMARPFTARDYTLSAVVMLASFWLTIWGAQLAPPVCVLVTLGVVALLAAQWFQQVRGRPSVALRTA